MDITKVSIIIPVYNAGKYVRDAIDSVLNQTFNDFELILVDDGSTDESGSIIDSYADKDSRVRVFHKVNGGVSSARNLGLDNAKGEWIAFADADDWFEKDALYKLYGAANRNNVDVVLANICKVGLENRQIMYVNKSEYSTKFLPMKHSALWGYLFRRDIIEKHRTRFVEGLAYSEDRVFMYAIAPNITQQSVIPDVVYNYRLNPDSVCASKDGERKFLQHIAAAKQLDLLCKVSIDSNYKGSLAKEIKHVISLGTMQYIKCSFKLKECFRLISFCESELGRGVFCAISFISNFLTFYRRKVVKLK